LRVQRGRGTLPWRGWARCWSKGFRWSGDRHCRMRSLMDSVISI
jgi:hypothetical protein